MEKKKLILIIVASVLALAVVITGAVLLAKSFFKGSSDSGSEGSATKSSITVSVGTAEGEVGSTVKIPVSCSDNPGFMAIVGDIVYDNAKLKYVGYEKGDFLTDYSFNDKGGVLTFLSVEDGDVKDNGVLFNLKFEIIAEDSGKTDVKVVIEEDEICNMNEELIPVVCKNGSVTISK